MLPLSCDSVTLAATAASAGLGAAVDLRTRRIPNVITGCAGGLGLGLAAAGISQVSLMSAALGLAVGLLLMLPGHLLGATGGGDVKLVAALGTILGPHQIIRAFFYITIAGGTLAMLTAVHRGRLRATLWRTARLMMTPATARREIESPGGANRFPYGPAIAAGSVLAAMGY